MPRDSGNRLIPKAILEWIETTAAGIRPLERREHAKKALFAAVRASVSCPEGEPEISFESMERELSKGLMQGACRVFYNPYTEVIVFEGIGGIDEVERAVELTNQVTIRNLRAELAALTGFGFQKAVAEILRNLPWVKRVEIRRLTADGGIDFDATYFFDGVGELAVCGQVKRTGDPTLPGEMRDFVGSLLLRSPRPNLGVFISVTGFGPGAVAAANAASKNAGIKVQTYTLEDLLSWMRGNGVGVTRRTIEVEEVDPTFWKEIVEGNH